MYTTTLYEGSKLPEKAQTYFLPYFVDVKSLFLVVEHNQTIISVVDLYAQDEKVHEFSWLIDELKKAYKLGYNDAKQITN
jgi:hypothetical protein